MSRDGATRFLLVFLSGYLIPVFVLGSVWVPLLNHYRVSSVSISDQMLERSRREPADSLLEELSGFRFFPRKWKNKDQLVTSAEKLLRGEVDLPGQPQTRIHIPFDPGDIDRGPQLWQLEMGGLAVPDVFLDAYKATRREEFFSAAREVILAWANDERRAWLPRGFLWNDHAVAARAAVLTEFWRLYRHRADFQPQTARVILEFAARTAKMLAKPGQFTVTTNHGVMQNLALWHLCLAFPDLVDRQNYKQLAFRRLSDQLTFYVNEEGVVLEHSAEYHALGVHLMELALRYMELLSLPVPRDWSDKYEKMRHFYVQLRRPDGSLPMFGDTDALLGQDGLSPLPGHPLPPYRTDGQRAEAREPHIVYPAAGYAVWWDGLDGWPDPQKLAQTVTAWSYFPGLGHKHADEMSVLFWAGGRAWWTNAGYWAYDDAHRAEAESWAGSNAPHLVNEEASGVRSTRLLSSAWSPEIAAVELERRGSGNYVAQRQVLELRPNLWMAVDTFSSDVPSRTTTTWTAAYDVQMERGPTPGAYSLRSANSSTALTAFVFGSPGTSVKEFNGSETPFAGWEAVRGTPQPAPAIVVEQPANDSWSVLLWSTDNGGEPSPQWDAAPSMEHFSNARGWRIILPLRSGTLYVRRDGDSVSFGSMEGEKAQTLTLERAPDVAPAVSLVLRAHAYALQRYPKFRDLLPYRLRVTYLLILIFALQEIFFAVYRRLGTKGYASLRIASIVGWLAVGIWLSAVYFRV